MSALIAVVLIVCSLTVGALLGWVARGDEELAPPRRRKKKTPLPPPDYIGRPPTCANGVEGCGIKQPHSHAEALMRRIKDK